MSRAKGAALVGVVGLVAAGLWVLQPSWSTNGLGTSSERALPGDGAERSPLSFTLPLDQALIYRWTLAQTNVTNTFAGQGEQAAVTAHMDLDAEVSLTGRRSFGEDVGAELRFVRFSTHDVQVQQKPLLDDAAARSALVDVPVGVTFGADGGVKRMQVPEGSPPMLERLAQLLLAETQLHLADGETWMHPEQTLHGAADATYTRHDERDGVTLEKVRGQYHQLRVTQLVPTARPTTSRAQYDIRFDSRGHLARYVGSETVLADDEGGREVLNVATTVSLTLERIVPASPAAKNNMAAVVPGAPALSEGELEAALRRRAEGLTAAQVLKDLATYGPGGQVPDHNRWLWRASAALRLSPEAVGEVAAWAMRKDTTHAGRELALDLLVGAGHEKGQAALLAALSSPAVQTDERYGMLFQRLNLLTSPGPKAVAFAERKKQSPDDKTRRLATNALGSMAGHLARGAEPAEGERIARGLAADLSQSEDEDDQEVLLIALGNAGFDEHRALVSGFADAPSSRLRHSAAVALRSLKDGDSKAVLLALAEDPVERVQIRALVSLDARGDVTASDRARLHDAVVADRIVEGAYPVLITLLGRHLHDDPQVAQTFGVMLEKPLQDSEIKARLRSMLGG